MKKMKVLKENNLTGYPKPFSYESIKIITEQMEKYICKIKLANEQATGFFCKIPFPSKDNMLPVLMLNNHTFNPKSFPNEILSLAIKSEKEIKKINLKNRKYYTDEEFDTTIIEIKEDDNIKNFLELDKLIIDDIINGEEKNFQYIDETIYVIQYPENKLSVSFGILDSIYADKKFNFNHRCSTRKGASGSAILNLDNKIIGIHKETYNNFNIGTFLNFPIKKFIEQNFNILPKKEKYNNSRYIKTSQSGLIMQDFCEKYSINIDENKIRNLDLSGKNIGIAGLEEIQNLNLTELEELYLDKNGLYDITNLEKIKSDNLKILCLNNNNINDIKILEKVKYNYLENLSLNSNNISDISSLEKVNFPQLKELHLSCNKIIDIKVLEKVKFPILENLYLDNNKIIDIGILSKTVFNELKKLHLFENNISDIKVFEFVKFTKLEELSLKHNNIRDISVLAKINMKALKKLYLNENKIFDLSVFANVRLGNIKILNLSNNEIDKDINAEIISNLAAKIKFFDI